MKILISICLLIAAPVFAQDTAAIDKAVNDVLKQTGAPSASIAVVKDGKIVYTHAYGLAHIDPPLAAASDMRYSIGSISKQFTASAILMLAEEGKIALDDKMARWFPDLTRASDVSVRELLSMTSGYQDFWPQDYVMPMMLNPVTPQEILNGWAKKPLDFEPGTKWQYSNTNYVIAGMIVEKVAGMPLLEFLQKRVFAPLQMTSVVNTDIAPLAADEPMRYMRYAVGPLRPAPKEGRGWMFAAGELAMTAQDLAKWDISMIDETILKPASYKTMETEVQLANGVGTHYGLGVGVGMNDGRRFLSHGGEVSGFTAQNTVYPDDRAAVVVQVNLDASGASGQIASRIANVLFASNDPAIASTTAQMQKIFEGLQHGQIDRSQFTSNANAYFNDQALKDFASSLGPLGKWQEFVQSSQSLRGGMTLRRYRIRFPQKTLGLTTFIMPDGKIEQYQIAAEGS
jgi:CubicO group peptidase (beta-lactamase class C family)